MRGAKFAYDSVSVEGLRVDTREAHGPPLGEDWLREHGHLIAAPNERGEVVKAKMQPSGQRKNRACVL